MLSKKKKQNRQQEGAEKCVYWANICVKKGGKYNLYMNLYMNFLVPLKKYLRN